MTMVFTITPRCGSFRIPGINAEHDPSSGGIQLVERYRDERDTVATIPALVLFVVHHRLGLQVHLHHHFVVIGGWHGPWVVVQETSAKDETGRVPESREISPDDINVHAVGHVAEDVERVEHGASRTV